MRWPIPAVRQRLAEIGQEIVPREQQTPEALGALQKAEIEKWWPIIKAANIKGGNRPFLESPHHSRTKVFGPTSRAIPMQENQDAVARGARVVRLDREFRWPGGRHVAVVLNVAYEGWSDGKAPGIGPMGNPLPAGAFDTNALSWGSYGATRGIERLLRVARPRRRRASVMVSGVFGERTPATVRAIVEAGHELVAHCYAQDIIPAQLSPEQVRADIDRTTAALEAASGATPARLDQPARHAVGRERAACWWRPAMSGRATCSTTTGPICRSSTTAPASSPFRSPWRSTTCRTPCASAARPGSIVELFDEALEHMLADDRRSRDDRRHRATPMSMGGRRAPGRSRRSPPRSAARDDVWLATRGEIAAHVRQSLGD